MLLELTLGLRDDDRARIIRRLRGLFDTSTRVSNCITPLKLPMSNEWQSTDCRNLYSILNWGEGYFDVAEDGHLHVHPFRDPARGDVDLCDVAQKAVEAGLRMPVLLRFREVLHDRVDRLRAAFNYAIGQTQYSGQYHCVYPIKVNQQGTVVEQIVSHGRGDVGLEAGSKPELMAVLGMSPPGGLIVCNGYKDREYIRLALIGQRLGHRIFLVIEKPSEVDAILREAIQLGVRPLLGLRIRLASVGAGNWQNSGGEKAKFGLSATQTLDLVEQLQSRGYLDCLQMLHFHLGSQIAHLRDIHNGLREAARYYEELHQLGASVNVMDVGGGLGVDYEGTRSRSFCSMNYSMDEYALNVVRAFSEVCRNQNLPEPEIITEAGRALTAHHAVLVTNVIDIESQHFEAPAAPAENASLILHDLWEVLENPRQRPPLECYHDAANWLAEAQAMYAHGSLSLADRAYAERMYLAVCHKLRPLLDPQIRSHRELIDELREKLADKYFCNLSVFQSLPDVWGIDQIFPIMPIHRLDEMPDRRVSLCDLTCDSDGRIDQYVDGAGLESSLPAHSMKPGEDYLLGFFMVGAYQEILGDMHNLFGDTDAVDVTLTDDGGWELVQPEHGDRVDELLRYVHMAPEQLETAYARKLERIEDANEREAFHQELLDGLNGYTYLEHE